MSSNKAAWLVAEKTSPLEIGPAPYYEPKEEQILVKNAAVAINPVDYNVQYHAGFPVSYPTILGCDLAGVVTAVGPGVTRFAPGDRVLGYATSLGSGNSAESAFQEYTLVRADCASIIPNNLPFEKAVVLPLAIATAAAALFGNEALGLKYPGLNPRPRKQTVLIWGGASSVGGTAVQLARLAGYEVISTASAKNHDYVKSLGADQVFDYKSPHVVEDITSALAGKELVGVYEASGWPDSVRKVAQIAAANGKNDIICARDPPRDISAGVTAKWSISLEIMGTSLAEAIYAEFLPRALAQGKLKAAPEPEVVGKGLEYIQTAIDTWNKGVSAKKIVVRL